MENSHGGLCPGCLGLALGITWGLGLLIVGLITLGTVTWGHEFVNVIGSVYIGFKPTFWGSIIGMLWGFADAFIAGLIIGWLYNCFSRPCSKKRAKAES